MRDIKFKFIIDKKYVSDAYTIQDLLNIDEDIIFESMDDKYNPCTCQPNESVTHCECDSRFEDSVITGRIQFTGLPDKNGKEIYEGDILGIKKFKWKVIFKDASFKLQNIGETNNIWGNLSRLLDVDMIDIYESIEIMGNIHENPELLK
jgi:uncharacterized phage protein (TIGR01671 family)